MKIFEQMTLLLITVLFLGVMIGILAGHHFLRSEVTLSVYDQINTTPSEMTQATQEDDHGKININTATVYELTILPGIGESTAQKIVDYRTEHGLFASIYDLDAVDGIGMKRIETLAEYITVGG